MAMYRRLHFTGQIAKRYKKASNRNLMEVCRHATDANEL